MDDQDIPVLIPIKKKKIQIKQNQNSKQQSRPGINNQGGQLFQPNQENPFAKLLQLTKNNKPQQSSISQSKTKPTNKQATIQKIVDLNRKFDQKVAVSHKNQDTKLQQINKKTHQNAKTKYMIAQMLNKIKLKNISQELYPVSNQHISQKIAQVQKQIKDLYTDAEKKEESILKNQNNQHLKKELNQIKKSIDHCMLIKQLYYQKINFRNKIDILEKYILDIKREKQEIQIESIKRRQASQSHALNQPCPRQRQLQRQLKNYKQKYEQQQKMKRKLQSNISQTINTFKRLYEQADSARKIVTQKLRNIQMRQKMIRQFNQSFSENSNSSVRETNSNHRNSGQSSQKRQSDRNRNDRFEKNMNTDRQRQRQIQKQKQISNKIKQSVRNNERNQRYEQLTPRKRQKHKKSQAQQVKVEQKKLTLQDQIKKMKSNQSIIAQSIKKF